MPEIGDTLRDARMRAHIDVSEIEAQTKIRAKYLRALENEEWGLLPGPTFVKSFLRTYAQALVDIGMIFQEPMTSLNPVLTIGRQITETLEQHRRADRASANQRAIELLGLVGIADPARRLKHYPHQLSGGMRQRVMIAIAIACDPKLIVADEPTTALDVTIQAQILELMNGLTRRLNVALIIITHNLGVVARYAKRVNVMYAGRIVESGPAAAIYHDPRHPYTMALLRSVPRLDRPRQARLDPVSGQPPDLTRLDQGCAFRPRCRFAVDACAKTRPPLEPAGPAGHLAACLRGQEIVAVAGAVA